MTRNHLAGALALVLALSAYSTAAAQTRRGNPAAPRPQQPRAVPLPASDAVLAADLRRLFNEAIPRALGDDKARIAEVNADVEQFKARTGIDARAFDTLAVGARVVRLESGATKFDHLVAIARGTFRPDAIVAAGRLAAKGAHREEKYGGKTIHVFGVNDQLKLFGLLKMKVGLLAMAVLEPDTLAVGEPEAVRAAVDAQAGRGRVDAALMNSLKGGEVIAFAANVPASAFAGVDVGLPEVNKSIAAVRGLYGSLGTTPAGFHMTTVLRTTSAADARQLGNTIDAVRQIAPGLISMAGERARFAKAAVDSLKITPQGNEVQLRMELAQGDVATLLRSL